ncbi:MULTISPECIES: excalibur calcium-binding domain-containing protein [unclassified Streptomyces]|uniref:excalibur calcium-binding domain-containing protein n=1 Tax=unclassified Streptomyces TaxID=2593676 RepID=UPI0035A92BD6
MYPPPPPFQPAPAPLPVRRWWQHPALIICLLVFLPPAGIALTWTSRWNQNKKVVATVLGALWFLLLIFSDPPEEEKGDAKGAAQPTVTATATPTDATAPTPTPSQTEETPAMPSLVGGTYADSEQLLTANLGRAYAAYKDVELPADYAGWTVCFQRPDAGAPVSSAVPVVYLTAPGVPCPKSPNEVLRKPTPTPKPKPTTPKPTRTQAPVPTQEPTPTPTEDAGDDSSSGGGSVYYRNCTAVRAAGAAPIHAGEPGYGRHLDRDGDGVACEG